MTDTHRAPAPARGYAGLGGGFPMGSPFGVPLRLHWSVVVIAALIAWALAAQALPAVAPGASTVAYAVAGTATSLLFLLGLLAHELSHAVVARRHGIEVAGITLWLFGGVAQLRGEATDPGTELRVAGIGPLVSLAIGLGFAGVALGAAAAGAPDVVVAALSWLAGINVLLAVFNVLPGAPLDGGRLLRAALWKWRGDRVWAAVTAARAGRVLGLVLVVLGVAQFLSTGTFAGVWLILIGWFVLGAAGAEEQAAVLGQHLAGVRVREVMTADPLSLPAGTTVAEFVEQHLLTWRHATVPVVVDGRPVGLVSLQRLRTVPEQRRPGTTLGQIAWPVDDLPLAGADEQLTDLLPRIAGTPAGRALVCADDGRLVGIVAPSDISRAVQNAALLGRGPGSTPPS